MRAAPRDLVVATRPNADVFGVVGQTLLGKYRVLRVVGQGGQAVVYEAEQLGLKRAVAIKFLQAGAFSEPDKATALARFQQEAEILASLSHPSIVHVYEIARHGDGETPLMVMEFVRGQSLTRRLQDRQRTPWPEAFELCAQAASALSAAHARDIVHRDVKPDNLVVSENGTLKVLDFGIAQLVTDLSQPDGQPKRPRLTGSHQLVGTFSYMSPEQFDTSVVLDGRSDVYSLGVVLYRMLSAKPIWPTKEPHEIVKLVRTTKPIDIQEHVPDLPQHAAELVRRALERDRTERFPSMEEMHRALRSCLEERDKEEEGTTAVKVSGDELARPDEPAPTVRARRSLRTGMIAVFLALVVSALAVWRFTHPQVRPIALAPVEVPVHKAEPVGARPVTTPANARDAVELPPAVSAQTVSHSAVSKEPPPSVASKKPPKHVLGTKRATPDPYAAPPPFGAE